MVEPNIIHEDLKVAISALDKRDYLHINIIGNRILSNSVFITNGPGFLVGYFIKDISLLLQKIDAIEQNDEFIKKTKDVLESFAYNIEKMDDDCTKYWKEYIDLKRNSRDFIIKKSELDNYTVNEKFTTEVCDELICLSEKREDMFLKDNNQFIKGLTHELDRIINEFDGPDNSYVLLVLFQSLSHLFNYYLMEAISVSMNFNAKILNDKFLPYIKKIRKIYDEQETFMINASELLQNIGTEWRRYFLYYLEPQNQLISNERRIELPPESRKKIGEIIKNSLERELN